eukprot:7671943-Alexandrium_andersonii.AAC.1
MHNQCIAPTHPSSPGLVRDDLNFSGRLCPFTHLSGALCERHVLVSSGWEVWPCIGVSVFRAAGPLPACMCISCNSSAVGP